MGRHWENSICIKVFFLSLMILCCISLLQSFFDSFLKEMFSYCVSTAKLLWMSKLNAKTQKEPKCFF